MNLSAISKLSCIPQAYHRGALCFEGFWSLKKKFIHVAGQLAGIRTLFTRYFSRSFVAFPLVSLLVLRDRPPIQNVKQCSCLFIVSCTHSYGKRSIPFCWCNTTTYFLLPHYIQVRLPFENNVRYILLLPSSHVVTVGT